MSDPVILSVGMTHPWNIAGTGLDLRIGAELGMRVVSVICAVSAQDGSGVRACSVVPTPVLQAQYDAVPWENIAAIRIGAMGSAANVRKTAEVVRLHPSIPAVVDPVFAATLGGELADEAAIEALRDGLATLSSVILTPNLAEAARLLGRQLPEDALDAAATDVRARGAAAVLLKGGHCSGDPIDVLAHAGGCERFSDQRLAVEMRGTGCALAMALACELARGTTIVDATRTARSFVRSKIAAAKDFMGLKVAY